MNIAINEEKMNNSRLLNCSHYRIHIFILTILLMLYSQLINMTTYAQAQVATQNDLSHEGPPEPSFGSYNSQQQINPPMISTIQTYQQPVTSSLDPTINITFEGYGFQDNPTVNNGGWANPPDPIAAAGTDRLVAVVNAMIEMPGDRCRVSRFHLRSYW